MEKIDINDKYINNMLNKYPLSEENDIDLRDYTLDMVSEITTNVDIPEAYDISFDLPVKVKQSWVGACNACTCTAATMIMKASDRPLSWWFVYANRKDTDWQGTGMKTRETLSNIKDFGITLLDLFNVMKEYPEIHDILINHPNKNEIFTEAAKNKIQGYIKVEKEDVKRLVSQGIPVLIGVRVYRNFYEAINNNYVIPSQAVGDKLGAHEMLIIGYKKEDYKLLNWWDLEWDHELYLNENAEIIMDYYIITDKPIIKPTKKKYTVGWNKDNKGWWYSKDGYSYCKEEWLNLKGIWYYFNKEGYALEGKWLQDKGKWYYFEVGSCAMKTGWLKYNLKWYYLDLKNGAMVTGWFQDKDGKWYYLDIDQGWMYAATTILIDGKYYTFDKSGAWVDTQVTASQLKQIGWRNADSIVADLNKCLSTFNITTLQQKAHFISQCAHESGLGQWTKEIGTGKNYEGRKGLGNIYTGDGPKYKGAGFLQLTGRSNYQDLADYLEDPKVMDGVDYVASVYPWTSAGRWWDNNNMNELINSGATCQQVSGKVNCGDPNVAVSKIRGLSDRQALYNKCLKILK